MRFRPTSFRAVAEQEQATHRLELKSINLSPESVLLLVIHSLIRPSLALVLVLLACAIRLALVAAVQPRDQAATTLILTTFFFSTTETVGSCPREVGREGAWACLRAAACCFLERTGS